MEASLNRFLRLSGPKDFPPPDVAWTQRGDACRKLGRIDEAAQSCRRALEINPKDARVLKKLEELGARK